VSFRRGHHTPFGPTHYAVGELCSLIDRYSTAKTSRTGATTFTASSLTKNLITLETRNPAAILPHVGDFSKSFGLAFSALLPLISPLRSSFLFQGLVGNAPAAVYQTLARKIAMNTTIFLLAILAMGTALLRFFGISLPVMQVAGGFVLAAMGWNLINQGESDKKETQIELDSVRIKSLAKQAFYPLTFPITAGPGCIVVMVTLSAQISTKGMLPSIAMYAGVVTAVAFLSLVVYLCYGYAPGIMARVSRQTVNGIIRVLAFVLLCIGVQIMWNGVEGLLKTLP